MPRYPWEHLGTKQELWSLQPPWVTHSQRQRGLYLQSARAAHPPTVLHRSRGQHHKTQSSIKSTSETLEQVHSERQSRSFISKSTPENRRSQLPATSTIRLLMAAIHVAGSITAHQPWEGGCYPTECLAAHTLWAFHLKTEQQKWSRKKWGNFCAALLI